MYNNVNLVKKSGVSSGNSDKNVRSFNVAGRLKKMGVSAVVGMLVMNSVVLGEFSPEVGIGATTNVAMAYDNWQLQGQNSAVERFEYEFVSEEKSTQNVFTGVIVEYDLRNAGGSEAGDLHFEIRFKENGGRFSEWVEIQADADLGVRSDGRMDALVNTNSTRQYQYRIRSNAGKNGVHPKVSGISFRFINPQAGVSSEVVYPGVVAGVQSMASLPGSYGSSDFSGSGGANLIAARNSDLRIISRREWGAEDSYNYAGNGSSFELGGDVSDVTDGDPEISAIIKEENGKILKWPMQYMKDVRMIVVHHTASTSSLSNPKQAIRNIQYYHAVSRGWGDIGYNFIVDQQGNIYEGRKGGPRVVGGHSLPVNKTSIGISVLGNFEDQKVPKAVVDAVSLLASDQADTYGLDVSRNVSYKGKSYPVLGGHRDNSATACPGANLYGLLPLIQHLAENGMSLRDYESSLSSKNYAYVDEDFSRDSVSLSGGQTKTIEVKLKNVGRNSWSRGNTYLKSLNASEISGSLTVGSGGRGNEVASLKESKVSPGGIGTFLLDVKATSGARAGAYSVMVQGVLDGVSDYSLPVFVPVHVLKPVTSGPMEALPGFDFEITGKEKIKLELDKGKRSSVSVTFKNTGDLPWNSSFGMVSLGVKDPKNGKLQSASQIFEMSAADGKSVVDFGRQEIAPGKKITVDLDIKAPNKDVTITESLLPIVDGVSWFKDGVPLVVEAKVGKGSLPEGSDVSLQADATAGELGPNIRVHISSFDLSEAEVVASERSELVVDGQKKGVVAKNEVLEVERRGSDVRVRSEDGSFTGSKVRLVPVSGLNNLITVLNYENRPAWNTSLNDNQFRHAVEFQVVDGKLAMINELPLEYYMRGVAEISDGSGAEKIKTIMVAARSYAYYYLTEGKGKKFAGKDYDLDDSPDRTQKYLGYGFEKRSPNVVKALKETAGKVITYEGKIVIVPYFSQSDGKTRSAKEVWNWDHTPYLISVSDPDCKGDGRLLGHGVGISGCGAAGMADRGKNHEEIIKYFLTGVGFKTVYGAGIPIGGALDVPVLASGENVFPDVSSETLYALAIKFMKVNGIVQGYPDGTFKPMNQINRAEFLKIIMESKFDVIPEYAACFPDTPQGEWFTKYVCMAKEKGIIEGHPDGTFKPADSINIAEALKIVLEASYGNVVDVPGEWFEKYKSYATNNNLFFGAGWSNLATKLTRGEMSELIFRIKTK